MKIIVSGSTGLVGTALLERLGTAHTVARLVRGQAGPGEIPWDPAGGAVDPGALSGADAVVHLAGEGIASRRWSAGVKARIRDSRVAGTRLLAGALAAADRPPPVGVVARILTGPHNANRQDSHLPMRYDTGRPRAVIRLRISQPRTTSLPCPAGLRARRPSPMMDLYRKNAFSTRP